MGVDDRMENTAEDLKGKAKEATGKVTDNERLEAEGKTDQAKADMKNAGRGRQGRLQALTTRAADLPQH